MTDQPTERDATTGQPASSGDASASSGSTPAPEREPPETFEDRMNRFGHEAGDAAERWGKRAEAAGARWSKDPSVVHVADTGGRIWGLILLAIGLWFFADITLGYDMPSIAWRDLGPIGLIAIGLLVLARGMTRRA